MLDASVRDLSVRSTECCHESTRFGWPGGVAVKHSRSTNLMRRAPLLLAVGGEPFEYPHPGWGDTVHLIGACTFEPGRATPAPDWVPRSIGRSFWSAPRRSGRPTRCLALDRIAGIGGRTGACGCDLPRRRAGRPARPVQCHGAPIRPARRGARPRHAVRSRTAAWARRSRRWIAVCRSASFRSPATRPRSRGASK